MEALQGVLLPDGRMATGSFQAIAAFFEANDPRGKEIKAVLARERDYMPRFMCADEEELYAEEVYTAVNTRGSVCLVFADGSTMEVQIPGSAPVVLGANTADAEAYRRTDGRCFAFADLFAGCAGKRITAVQFEATRSRMQFPIYAGQDCSQWDDGVQSICFVLEDGSKLMAKGYVELFAWMYLDPEGEPYALPFGRLCQKLEPAAIEAMLEREEEF